MNKGLGKPFNAFLSRRPFQDLYTNIETYPISQVLPSSHNWLSAVKNISKILLLSQIKALSERKHIHVQRKCTIWRIALYKFVLRTTIISQRQPFFKIFFLEIVACPIVWAQQLCKINNYKLKMNWNLLSLAQKILSKKVLLENFQWYKKQHEKEIAAWRLGCSTILMLLEILWVFDKYLPQPCFPEWHENREIIQRDVKNIFPSIKK